MERLSEVEERLGKQLAWATKAAQIYFDQALSRIGSSFHTYLVLRHVELYPGVSQRELARRLGIEGPTLTHHLDRLTSDGLVDRIRGIDDRRTYSAVLTAKGRTHLRKAIRCADRLDDEFCSLFTPSELEDLRKFLRRISHYYGRLVFDDNHTGAV
jgi:MarR family transcriptional regulator, transcriptional regulator for hemolysin